MGSASQNTYLLGQTLRANTFNSTPIDSTIPRLGELISPIENRGTLETTADQKTSERNLDVANLVIPPPASKAVSPSGTRLRPRQSWEGTVIERKDGSFIARVTDRTNPSHPDEIVTFGLDEISEEDQKLVAVGSSFYWTIGTEKSPAGQIKNVDMVSFRRLPHWKESSVREAEQEARNVLQLLLSE